MFFPTLGTEEKLAGEINFKKIPGLFATVADFRLVSSHAHYYVHTRTNLSGTSQASPLRQEAPADRTTQIAQKVSNVIFCFEAVKNRGAA